MKKDDITNTVVFSATMGETEKSTRPPLCRIMTISILRISLNLLCSYQVPFFDCGKCGNHAYRHSYVLY